MRRLHFIYASMKTLIFLSFLHCFESSLHVPFAFMNDRYKAFVACSFQLTLSNHHHHYSSFIGLTFIMANTSSTPVCSNVASNHKTGPKKTRKQAGLPNKLKGFVFNETNAACILCGGKNLPLSHADAQTDDGHARVFQVTQTIKLPDGTVC